MEPQKQTSGRLDRVLWTVLFTVMAFAPLTGPITLGSVFLLPVPLIILNVLVSPIAASLLVLGAALVYLFFSGFPTALLFFLMCGSWSQLLGFMIRRHSRVSRVLFWGTAFLLMNGLLFAMADRLMAVSQIQPMLDSFSESVRTALASSSYQGMLEAGQLDRFIPFFLLYLLFLYTVCNFMLARWVLSRRGVAVIGLGGLEDFQLPERVLQGTGLLFAMGLLVRLSGWGAGETLTDTLIYLLFFVYMFQGLGLTAFLMERREVPKPWRLLILAGLLLLVGPVGLALAGIADILMDLRKQRRNGKGGLG